MQKNVGKVSINYSPNFDNKKRSASKVKYLIFHYTGMKSENAAIKNKTHPMKWTERNIETMKQQLKSLGYSYAW